MADSTTASESAHLERVEKEIEQLQTVVNVMKMQPQLYSVSTAAAKHKQLGLKIEEREVILEKRRMAEVVRKFEQEHPQQFDPCPICLEDVISVHHLDAVAHFDCCGKSICMNCNEEATGALDNCPLCRAEIPSAEDDERMRLRLLAEKGVAWAQYNIAIAQDLRRKTENAASEENQKALEEEALLWYRRAAEKGYAPAEFKVGLTYLNGESLAVPRPDRDEGARWTEAAAAHGNASAQELLGLFYFHDLEDMEKSMHWCTLAASRGKQIARVHLGIGFARGVGGLDKNLERAKYYLEDKRVDEVSADFLGEAQYTLSGVHLELSEKRYGCTAMFWAPGHNCTFQMMPLLRKAVVNGCDAANSLIQHWEEDRGFCLNCMRSQEDISAPLLRCSRCKLVWYCGKECQREHWKSGHKVECKKYCSGED